MLLPRAPAARAMLVLALAWILGTAAGGSAVVAAQSLNETLTARQKALGKGKRAYAETFLGGPSGGASEKDLKLAAKVAVFLEPPRERLEISPVSGKSFGEPVVIVSNGKGYFLITKVGSTPLEKSAKASDPLVLQVLSSSPSQTAKKRQVTGAGGKLLWVVYRESRTADFNSATAFSLKPTKVGGGLLKKGLASFADSDDTVVTASAGARGVDEIETPEGKVSVTPDSAAVVWLESLEVSPLEFEAFLLAGGLGPYAGEGGQ
jgi:hypothetical protein